MIVRGPSSPPITSMAIRITRRFYKVPPGSTRFCWVRSRDTCNEPCRTRRTSHNPEKPDVVRPLRSDGPGGPCSNRSAGRPGAVPSIHDTEDTFPPGRDSRRRACAAWPLASWNGGVWDSARLVLLLSIQQLLQRCQPGIDPFWLTSAVCAIQVRTAFGAQAPARFRAERLHRQCELKLLAQHLDDVEGALPVKGGRQVVFADLSFPLGRGLRLRHVAQLEARADRHFEIVEAASTLELKPRDCPARDSKDPDTHLLDVHRELDRRRDAIILVRRVKRRRLECPFEVLSLAVKLPEIEEHSSLVAHL